MLVIAHHNVTDPAFWASAEENSKNIPGYLKLHGVYPSKDGKTGTCLWEAESSKAVQEFIDSKLGEFSKNFCYEVDVEKSMGLPNVQAAAASLS